MSVIELKIHVAHLNGKAVATVDAFNGGELFHSDKVTLDSARSRKSFINSTVKKCKLCGDAAKEASADLEAQLMAELYKVRTEPPLAPGTLDISRIVRPELFITPAVVGVCVAEPCIIDNAPAGRWRQYLLWSDGKRECSALDSSIELPDGSRLWRHPTPGEPSPNTLPGWTPNARQAWLGGAKPPDAADVFKRLCEAFAYYLDFPSEHAAGMVATAALWVMLSYIFPAWCAIPYLFLGGPLGSGKSRLFDVLQQVVFRALASSNMTAAALFRTINDRGGTLLLDEAERLRETTPDAQELKSILLAGYRRGGRATRLEAVGDTFRHIEFDVYGPKALACIAGLPPELASRCITFSMFRAPPGSVKPKRRIDENPQRWTELRDDLHALLLGPLGQAALELSNRTDVCEFDGRNYELWQPLLAIAAWLEKRGVAGLADVVHEYAALSIEHGREELTPDTDEIVLRTLADMTGENLEPTPGEVLKRAKTDEEELFARWTPRRVSALLKRYGVETTRGKRRVYRDITSAALLRIQRSYSIALGIEDEAPIHPPFIPTLPTLPTPEAVAGGVN